MTNPEFLKEGDAREYCPHPYRVIIGAEDEKSAEILKELYEPFVANHEKFIVMDVKSAEMTKYVANTMLATKISFINEITNICEKTGTNVQNVRLDIGFDKHICYKFVYVVCGYGGLCFPKDVKCLINTSLEYDYAPDILSKVNEINEAQKMIIVNKIINRFRDDLNNLTSSVWN